MRVEAQQARAGWPVRSCRPEGEARHTAAEATLGPENVGGPVVTANAEGEAPGGVWCYGARAYAGPRKEFNAAVFLA